jgi:K+-sensing histidine kinase KdpD
MVHEVRTPLSALATEVELALRRDRSPAAYREALSRIAGHTADLVDLTSDLAVLAECEQPTARSHAIDLEVVASQLSMRYDDGRVDVSIPPQPRPVAGDGRLLGRALRLVLDHALRARTAAASPVRLRTATPIGTTGGVDLIVDAASPGFAPQTWQYLAGDHDLGQDLGHGLIRLRAASLLVRASGGSITVECAEGASRLRIHLPSVSPCVDAHRTGTP